MASVAERLRAYQQATKSTNSSSESPPKPQPVAHNNSPAGRPISARQPAAFTRAPSAPSPAASFGSSSGLAATLRRMREAESGTASAASPAAGRPASAIVPPPPRPAVVTTPPAPVASAASTPSRPPPPPLTAASPVILSPRPNMAAAVAPVAGRWPPLPAKQNPVLRPSVAALQHHRAPPPPPPPSAANPAPPPAVSSPPPPPPPAMRDSISIPPPPSYLRESFCGVPPPPPAKRGSFISPSNASLLAALPEGNEETPGLPPRLRPRPSLIATKTSFSSSSSSSSSIIPPSPSEWTASSPSSSPASAPRGPPPPLPTHSLSRPAMGSPLSARGALASGEDDDEGGMSFLEMLRETAPSVSPLTRAERFTLAQGRSARTRDLLAVKGEELTQPDYAIHVLGVEEAEDAAKEAWLDAYGRFQERHAQAWKDTVGWMASADTRGDAFLARLREKRAKALVRAGGIPPSWRGGIWEVLVGARKLRLDNAGYYSAVIAQLATHATKSTRDIEKDVARTMHGHALFAKSDGEGQAQLKRGLCAFSFRHPAIGYAQSMSTVLATLLLHFPSHGEEQAWWVFERLLIDVLPGDYYTPSMIGVRTDCAVLKRIVRKRLPRLAAHLARKTVDLDMISLPWFLCIYVHVLPLATAMRIWDALFYKGAHVLLSVAAALLARHEERILAQASTGEIFTTLQTLGKEEYDCEQLLHLALGKQHVRACDATRMREEVRAELEAQYLKQVQFK